MTRTNLLLALALSLVTLTTVTAADPFSVIRTQMDRMRADVLKASSPAKSPLFTPVTKLKVKPSSSIGSPIDSRVILLQTKPALGVEHIWVSKGSRLKNYTDVSVRLINSGRGSSTGREIGTLFFEINGQTEQLTSQGITLTAPGKAAVVNYTGTPGRSFAGGTFIFVLTKNDGSKAQTTRQFVE